MFKEIEPQNKYILHENLMTPKVIIIQHLLVHMVLHFHKTKHA